MDPQSFVRTCLPPAAFRLPRADPQPLCQPLAKPPNKLPSEPATGALIPICHPSAGGSPETPEMEPGLRGVGGVAGACVECVSVG